MDNLSNSFTIYQCQAIQYMLCIFAMIAIPACSSNVQHSKPSYPLAEDERELTRIGRITGPSGFELYVSSQYDKDNSTNNKPQTGTQQSKNISQYKGDTEQRLWLAALEVTRNMPLLSTDKLGGVIITDWYTQHIASNERQKFCIYIIRQSDNAPNITVTAFTQHFDGSKWHNVITQESTAMSIRKKILEKAKAFSFKDSEHE